MRSAPTDRMQPVGEDRIFPLRCCGGRMISAPTNRTTRRGRSHLTVALLRRGVVEKRVLLAFFPGRRWRRRRRMRGNQSEILRWRIHLNVPAGHISHPAGIYHTPKAYITRAQRGYHIAKQYITAPQAQITAPAAHHGPKKSEENRSPVTTEVSRESSAAGTAKRVFLIPTLPKYSASV